MIRINGLAALERTLNSPIDLPLKRLLTLRRDQLAEFGDEFVSVLIVEIGDQSAAIEDALGWSPFVGVVNNALFPEPDYSPPFEWVADHGSYFEAPVIYDDSGRGVVLIVGNDDRVAADLLALLRAYAVPVQGLGPETS